MNIKELKVGQSITTQKVTAMKVIKKPEDAEPHDPSMAKVFEDMLSLGLRVGYDPESGRGIIGLGRVGDLHFGLSGNDPALHFCFNDSHLTHSFKVDYGAVKDVLHAIITMKKQVTGLT